MCNVSLPRAVNCEVDPTCVKCMELPPDQSPYYRLREYFWSESAVQNISQYLLRRFGPPDLNKTIILMTCDYNYMGYVIEWRRSLVSRNLSVPNLMVATTSQKAINQLKASGVEVSFDKIQIDPFVININLRKLCHCGIAALIVS